MSYLRLPHPRCAIALLLCGLVLMMTMTGCTTSRATGRARPSRAAPGPAWADTNQDGYLSDSEYQQALRKIRAKR